MLQYNNIYIIIRIRRPTIKILISMKEGSLMATKSILKEIDVRDKKFANNLINALEHAANKGSIEVRLTKPVSEVKREQIKKLFGEKEDEGL